MCDVYSAHTQSISACGGGSGEVIKISDEAMAGLTTVVACWAMVPQCTSSFRPPRATISLTLVRVVTDIDDTIKSSGGVALAGIALGGVDTSYSRGTFYPGVFRFAAELASSGAEGDETPLDVAVLTARAEEFRLFLEIKQSDKLCLGFRHAALWSHTLVFL